MQTVVTSTVPINKAAGNANSEKVHSLDPSDYP